jgi:hypothetical protein
MNRDDIIRMAREVADIQTDSRGREEFIFDSYGVESFANLVAAAEREACAKVCEEIASSGENNDRWTITRDIAFNNCAFAIRERGAP